MFGKKQRKKETDAPLTQNRPFETSDHAKLFESVMDFCRYLAGVKEQCEQQSLQLAQVLELRSDDLAMLEKCFATAADCQKQTAQIANSQMERHALHPAIITVDLLADLIGQMALCADAIAKVEPDSDVEKLVGVIREAQRIATSQMEHLDAITICPQEFEPLDNDRHEIVKAVDTNDKSGHKKIHQTLKPGLIYRESVLRRAKVAIYCLKKTETECPSA